MALIIEELDRAQRVQTRYRMEGERLTLGRGYDNDIVLDDVHADAVHAQIHRDEDGIYHLRDLGSVNGIRLLGNERDKSVEHAEIDEREIASGDLVQLGKTHLRLSDSEVNVPEAVPLHSLEGLFERLSHPAGAIGLLVLVALATLLTSYLGFAREFKWTTAINLLAGSAIGLLLYAGAWAFIGRVVRHETRFFTHLTIAALGAVVYTAWERINSLLDYNFAIGNLLETLDVLVLALLLPAMLWCGCYLATNLSRLWRWGVALVLPWGFLGLTLAEDVGNMEDFSSMPRISTELKYKGLLFRQPEPMAQFIADSPELFDIPIEEDKDSEEAKEEATEIQEESAAETES